MFVVKKMNYSDWVDKDGIGLLQIDANIDTFEPKQDAWWNADILSQVELFLRTYGKPNFNFFAPTHNITILSKKACQDIFIQMPELYNKTIQLKGREFTERITRLLFEYVAIYKGYCKINEKQFEKIVLNYESDYTNYKLNKNIKLLCTNLNSKLAEDDYNEYLRFMLNIFPKKLPCEKFMRYENKCYYRYSDSQMCKTKQLLQTDNINIFPKNFKKNMTNRLNFTKKFDYNKRKKTKNTRKK
jgi:hypothetical protein